MKPAVMQIDIGIEPSKRGKVRDVFDFGDRLLIVATDRISAYDWVLETGIPDKGRVLTMLSTFWFALLNVPSHFISTDTHLVPLPKDVDREMLEGRSMVVVKTEVVPIECVVRGYLVGSGWKEYSRDGTVCGIKLPVGLKEGDQLVDPIFTPATKAETGHDENISFERMMKCVGVRAALELRTRSMEIYRCGAEYARKRGIIIADTKFEWGRLPSGELILIDEVLTPDSSRFWPADQYRPGQDQPSFDKQFVRDWLTKSGWDKNSPPPPLPDEVVHKTRDKYIEAYERLTGQSFPWK